MSDRSKEFDEGFAAYQAGCGMAVNPYDPIEESNQRDEWASGYLHADYLATPITERDAVTPREFGEVVA